MTGTPTAAGDFTFVVRATNSVDHTDTGSITIHIDPAAQPPVFTATSPPTPGTVGVVYPGYQFTATGDSPITYAVNSGILPTGLALTAGGSLTGTPTAAGDFTFVVRATNSVDHTDTGSITIHIDPAAQPPVFTATSPPTPGTVGVVYPGYQFTATGDSPITYAVNSGILPTGLALTAGGSLTGTPTAAGDFTFVVRATNSVDHTDTGSITIHIDPAAQPPVFTATSPPTPGTVGVVYPGYQFTATGDSPITYAVNSGILPTGLALTAGGSLTGTPTAAGDFTFVVRATNSVDHTDTGSITIHIDPAAQPPVFTGYSATHPRHGRCRLPRLPVHRHR